MSRPVCDRAVAIGVDALVEVAEFLTKLSDSTRCEVAQVAVGKAGVLAADFDLTAESEVVTGEHAGARHEAGREGFVVAVSKANNPAVVALAHIGLHNFHHAKVARAFVAERMALATDGEPCAFELGLNFLQQRPVSEWKPCGCATRGGYGMECWPVDEFSPAVEQHAANRWLWILDDRVGNGSVEVDDVIHDDDVWLLVGLLFQVEMKTPAAIT